VGEKKVKVGLGVDKSTIDTDVEIVKIESSSGVKKEKTHGHDGRTGHDAENVKNVCDA
jgi:hypothetical protein